MKLTQFADKINPKLSAVVERAGGGETVSEWRIGQGLSLEALLYRIWLAADIRVWDDNSFGSGYAPDIDFRGHGLITDDNIGAYMKKWASENGIK